MIDKVLQEIAETEERAAALERQAELDAAALVREAVQSAQRMQREGVERDESRMSAALTAFDAEQQRWMENALHGEAGQLDSMQRQAEAQLPEAVALLVEGVVSAYGHR